MLFSVFVFRKYSDFVHQWVPGFRRFVTFIRYSNNQLIDLEGRVFANDPGDLDSIPGRVIPKTLKNGT